MFVILAQVQGKDHAFSKDEESLVLVPIGEQGLVGGAMAFSTVTEAKQVLAEIRESIPDLEAEYGPFEIGQMTPFH